MTSIVAIRFATASARERALEQLRQRGADAVPLGQDSIVAHLGARRAVGNEARSGSNSDDAWLARAHRRRGQRARPLDSGSRLG